MTDKEEKNLISFVQCTKAKYDELHKQEESETKGNDSSQEIETKTEKS